VNLRVLDLTVNHITEMNNL